MVTKRIGGFAKLHVDGHENGKQEQLQLVKVPIGGFAFVEIRRGTRISGLNEKATLREKRAISQEIV